MASRHIRRLQQQLEVAQDGGAGESSPSPSSSGDEEDAPASQGARMGFSLLCCSSDEGDGNGDDSEDEQELEVKRETPRQQKKKKKKKKKKHIAGSKPEDIAVAAEDDIDSLCEKFGFRKEENAAEASASNAAGSSRGRSGHADIAGVLSVDVNFLTPEREMRRMFGAEAVRGTSSGHRGHSSRSHNHRGPGQGRNIPRLRKNLLFPPEEGWPKPDIGLSMAHRETKSGLSYFEYETSDQFRDIQAKYEQVAAQMDPNLLGGFLQKYPFHLDTLTTLSYVLNHTGDYSQADALIHRSLYVLESAFHPWFEVASGNCRLEYAREPNRVFFKVLFRHVTSLSRRGCHRSALETLKLMLSLDHSDPMGLLFCIDYAAIRAREYDFVLQLAASFDTGKTLSLYPNFAFSTALAKWQLEQSSEPADLQESTLGVANHASGEILKQAMLIHPFALKSLVEKLDAKGCLVDKHGWDNVLEVCPRFRTASCRGSASLAHLVKLFVEKQYDIWKDIERQHWLLQAARKIAAASGDKDDDGGGSADWDYLISQVFPASDVNEYRHIDISEFSSDEGSNHIPQEVLMQLGVNDGNQHMGADAHGFDVPAHALGQTTRIGQQELREGNPLSLFLQSLLPWVSVESQPSRGNNNNAGNGNGDGNDGAEPN